MSGARTNLLGLTDPAPLDRAEGELSRARAIELEFKPLRGNFDVPHLQAINRFIFKDVYADAGALRSERGQWGKARVLSSGERYNVYYKPADEMLVELPKVLGEASTQEWSRLNTPQALAPALAKLYADIDFQHPFVDGNSRTLRVFTRQWVLERTSQKLTWDHLMQPGEQQDVLYRARDAEVLGRAMTDALIANESDLRMSARLRHAVSSSGRTLPELVERGLVIGMTQQLVDPKTSSKETADRIVAGVVQRYDSSVERTQEPADQLKKKGPER